MSYLKKYLFDQKNLFFMYDKLKFSLIIILSVQIFFQRKEFKLFKDYKCIF
jgi:hypothetical protein